VKITTGRVLLVKIYYRLAAAGQLAGKAVVDISHPVCAGMAPAWVNVG
jgi:hypothetical protein